MATCPRCMGALTEDHRCPRGAVRRTINALSPVLIGCAVGAVFCFVLVERPVPALVLAAAALGGVLGSAVRQAIGGRP